MPRTRQQIYIEPSSEIIKCPPVFVTNRCCCYSLLLPMKFQLPSVKLRWCVDRCWCVWRLKCDERWGSSDKLQLYIVKKVRFQRSAFDGADDSDNKRALGRGFDPRLGHYARVTQWSEWGSYDSCLSFCFYCWCCCISNLFIWQGGLLLLYPVFSSLKHLSCVIIIDFTDWKSSSGLWWILFV